MTEPYDPYESRNRALGLPADAYSEADPPHHDERKDFKCYVRNLGEDGWEFSLGVTPGRTFFYKGDRDRMMDVIAELERGAKIVRDSISLHDCPLCDGKVMCLPRHRFYRLGIKFECLECGSRWDYDRNTDFDEKGDIYVTKRHRWFTDRTKACGWWDRFAIVLDRKRK